MGDSFRKNLKGILDDEYIHPDEELYGDSSQSTNSPRERSFLSRGVEQVVNLVRFELLYPKLRESYDFGGATGEYPRGAVPSALVNMALGAYIGSKIAGTEGAVMGAFISYPITFFAQAFAGMGVRALSDYVSRRIHNLPRRG